MAAAKNLDPPGTSIPPVFTVLDKLADDHLLRVAHDSCIRFNPINTASISPSEFLSVIRASEVAHATLAAAKAAVAIPPPESPGLALGVVAPTQLVPDGCGRPATVRRKNRRAASGLVPCRSSLCIKNLYCR